MSDITIHPYDAVYMRVSCDDAGITNELYEFFTFDVPGARHMPTFKNGMWDGKIRLFNTRTGLLYAGLLDKLVDFADTYGYQIDGLHDFADHEFSVVEAKKVVGKLNLPHEPYEFQMEAFIHAVRKRRTLLLSPTASGKSLIIYMIARTFEQNTLIIVPTIGLVKQMYTDMLSYGCPEDMLHKIEAGGPKEGEGTITITTWQSIYKMPEKWFQQFSVVIGDEAHQYKANSLKGIMEKCRWAPIRIGLTGTLDGTPTHKLVLEGLFGGVRRVASTSELMEEGKIAQLKIKAIILSYPEQERKELAKIARKDYQAEVDWLINRPRRNKFIRNLALSLEGNTLVLFRRVEDHGEVLYDMIKEKADPERQVFFIHGKVDGEEREEVRGIMETSTNAICVASQGTFSTGTNIRNLHNVIFVHPSKSKILVLQSIGRALRISDTKSAATLYDIADDLTVGSWKNTTLKHFVERLDMYVKEKFDFKTYTVKLEPKQ